MALTQEQLKSKIIGLKIKGLTASRIEALINSGIIRKVEDVYRLHDFKEKILKIKGFGEKTLNGILGSITAPETIDPLTVDKVYKVSEEVLADDLTEEEYNKLVVRLVDYNEAYRQLKPIVSDGYYNILYDKCEQYEIKNKITNGISSLVGGKLDVKVQELVKHQTPMLSIGNASLSENSKKNFGKIFYDKHLRKNNFIVTPKIDGYSLSAKYSKTTGLLVALVGRGEGHRGQNLIHFADQIGVPRQINSRLFDDPDHPEYIEIVGEVVIDKNLFKKEKEKHPELTTPLAYLGVLRGLDSDKVQYAKDNVGLKFVVHSVPATMYNYRLFETKHNFLEVISKLGFETVEYELFETNGLFTKEQVIKRLNEILIDVKNKPYDCDGLVYGFDNLKDLYQAGTTSKLYKGLIAIKPDNEFYKVKIINIQFNTGTNGITPVAEYEPITINGKTFNKASLANIEMMRKKQIGIGSICALTISDGIIPKIEEVVDGSNTKYNEPTHCNICKHELEDNNSGLECPNPNCESKIVHRIFKATRKDALDIKGLGKAKIQALYDHGVLESIPDLYKLKDHRDKLFDIPKFGEKTIDNLLGAIDSTIGTVTAQRFIKALNISSILGNNGAKLMIQNKLFNSFKEDFLMMDLTGIAGFGEKSIDDWNSFIADADRIKEYTELVHLVKPIDPVYEGQGGHSQQPKQHSSNKTLFHISGRVNGIFDGIKTKIEMAGYIEEIYPFLEYSPNFNKSVNLLFYDKPSKKTANILETVSSIEEFLKLKKRGNTQNQWKIRFDLLKESLNTKGV